MNTLVGIKNCDSVKKAKKWLEQNGVDYAFHDLREQGVDKAALEKWLEELGWEVLLNKRSTTWKELSDAERADIDRDKAMMLLLAYPTLIKRPVLITPDGIRVGFKEAEYKKAFGK
ncbi:MAG: ArsC family reductase [Gammaproteobacteria bacterium]|nr:ArsC family reductase [Gammaproteobacteria bacterium]MCW8840415.1 ArsC family reductase [Gammaproteobacteria bacterium]MCW8959018.1 ArsC family reductase [Gammaproteobacteria bacterium]MCW8972283.1 ArsC family reductase [Gammaproteobacteria bacterium]MCW8991878.1 ArsC family reductase [Gammaproteobacteria bacterium]